MANKLQQPKGLEINGKQFNIGKIPCIPGIQLFTECSSIVDAESWNEIDVKALLKLAPYAEIIRDGVAYSLDTDNACISFLTTEELWKICLEVYAYNFGFFINGGTQSVMKPLIDARKVAEPEK